MGTADDGFASQAACRSAARTCANAAPGPAAASSLRALASRLRSTASSSPASAPSRLAPVGASAPAASSSLPRFSARPDGLTQPSGVNRRETASLPAYRDRPPAGASLADTTVGPAGAAPAEAAEALGDGETAAATCDATAGDERTSATGSEGGAVTPTALEARIRRSAASAPSSASSSSAPSSRARPPRDPPSTAARALLGLGAWGAWRGRWLLLAGEGASPSVSESDPYAAIPASPSMARLAPLAMQVQCAKLSARAAQANRARVQCSARRARHHSPRAGSHVHSAAPSGGSSVQDIWQARLRPARRLTVGCGTCRSIG